MGKQIIILMLVLMLPSAYGLLEMCQDTVDIGTNCTMVTPTLTGCSIYNYTLINVSDSSIYEQDNLTLLNSNIYYFNLTAPQGDYIIELCDATTREVKIKAEEDKQKMAILAIIILPMLLGFFFLMGARLFDKEEHDGFKALKFGLFLLSLPMFLISIYFAGISIIKFYNFPIMLDALGSVTYWISLIFYVILSVFAIYIIWMLLINPKMEAKRKSDNYEDD